MLTISKQSQPIRDHMMLLILPQHMLISPSINKTNLSWWLSFSSRLTVQSDIQNQFPIGQRRKARLTDHPNWTDDLLWCQQLPALLWKGFLPCPVVQRTNQLGLEILCKAFIFFLPVWKVLKQVSVSLQTFCLLPEIPTGLINLITAVLSPPLFFPSFFLPFFP